MNNPHNFYHYQNTGLKVVDYVNIEVSFTTLEISCTVNDALLYMRSTGIEEIVAISGITAKDNSKIQKILDGMNVTYTSNIEDLFKNDGITYVFNAPNAFIVPTYAIKAIYDMINAESTTTEDTTADYVAIIEYTEENKPMAVVFNRRGVTRKHNSITCSSHHRLERIIKAYGNNPAVMHNDIGCTAKYSIKCYKCGSANVHRSITYRNTTICDDCNYHMYIR